MAQKLHQTTMKIFNSYKKQFLVISLYISMCFLNWGSELKAQLLADLHIIEQDTTSITNLSEILIPVLDSEGFFKKRGYMNFVSIGFLPGSQDVITATPVSLDMSHGFYNPAGLYIGAGLAVETFDPALMPIFGDLRLFLTKGDAKPLIRATIGYSIPLSNRPNFNEKGGANAGIGAGMIFSISNRTAFCFYLGYRYQKLKSTITDYYGHETKLYTEFNRMEFRLGLSFH